MIILIGLPLYVAAQCWLLTLVILMLGSGEVGDVTVLMLRPSEWEFGAEWLIICGIPVAVLVASQAAFLIPVLRRRPPSNGRAKSLRLSMVAAGLVGAALTCGLGLGLIGLAQLLVRHFNSSPSGDPVDAIQLDTPLPLIVGFFGVLIVSWVFWSLLLLSFSRRRQGRGVLERTIGLLLGGTILEVILTLPVDIMIRRKTDCYCASGTFGALCLSAWALLWLAGPGIVIAVLSKRRRLWIDTHCANCGYEKGPSPAAKCPECGNAW
jgi:hypothetical protein